MNTSAKPPVGPAFDKFDSALNIPPGQEGVAEAARQNRKEPLHHATHIYTNSDIARLRQAAGEPPAGMAETSVPVTNQKTMPGSDINNLGQHDGVRSALKRIYHHLLSNS